MHKQQSQPLGPTHLPRKLQQQRRVAEIPSKRGDGHRQVLSDQERDRVGVGRGQSQPRSHAAGQLFAQHAVVFDIPLGGIVQEQGQVQQVATPQAPRRFRQHAPLVEQRFSRLNRPQRVFVHRIGVVLVELQQAADMLELGQHIFQQPDGEQFPQHPPHAPFVPQDREKAFRHLGSRRLRPARCGLPDRIPQVGRNLHPVARRQLVHLQQQSGVVQNQFPAAARGENLAGSHLEIQVVAPRGAEAPELLPQLPGAIPVHKAGGDVGDRRHMQQVLSHELLDRALGGIPGEAKQASQPDLLLASQNLLRFPRMEMELGANAKQKLGPCHQAIRIGPVEMAPQPQQVEIGCPMGRVANPLHQLHIAQSPGRALDVGFELTVCATILGPFRRPGCQAVAIERGVTSPADGAIVAGSQPGMQRFAPPEQPGLHESRGEHRILPGEVDRVRERRDPMPQLNPGIPAIAHNLRNHLVVTGRFAILHQEEQVDVGVGDQFTPTTSSDGDDGGIFPQHLLGRRPTPSEDRLEQVDQQAVDRVGDEAGGLRDGRTPLNTPPGGVAQCLQSSFKRTQSLEHLAGRLRCRGDHEGRSPGG